MGNRSKARLANGIIAAIIVVFFLAHGALGCTALVFGHMSSLVWIVWIFMALVVVHVVVSVVTSREQLTDAENPPSPRKKRHLALKWATGAGLAACVAAHVLLKDAFSARAVIVGVAVTLAIHLCVGSKSLLADLNISRRFQTPFRIVVCAFAAMFVAAVFVSM